jgi:hypothetical protein
MKAACAIAAAGILMAGGAARMAPVSGVTGNGQQAAGYQNLISLFNDWRAFQKPKIVDGVPDSNEQPAPSPDSALG